MPINNNAGVACVCRALTAEAKICPVGGCSNAPDEVVDVRDGILLWSDPDTWSNAELFPNGKPTAGQNVSGAS